MPGRVEVVYSQRMGYGSYMLEQFGKFLWLDNPRRLGF